MAENLTHRFSCKLASPEAADWRKITAGEGMAGCCANFSKTHTAAPVPPATSMHSLKATALGFFSELFQFGLCTCTEVVSGAWNGR